MKNVSFIFTKKPKALFGQPKYFNFVNIEGKLQKD